MDSIAVLQARVHALESVVTQGSEAQFAIAQARDHVLGLCHEMASDAVRGQWAEWLLTIADALSDTVDEHDNAIAEIRG